MAKLCRTYAIPAGIVAFFLSFGRMKLPEIIGLPKFWASISGARIGLAKSHAAGTAGQSCPCRRYPKMATLEGMSATFVDEFDAYMLITDTIESLFEAHNAHIGICSDEAVIYAALDARVDTIMESLAEQIAHWRACGADTKTPPTPPQ
jgi:hypothetical protein